MSDYPFLEDTTHFDSTQNYYPLAPDIQHWIQQEMGKRVEHLKTRVPEDLQVFKTLRSFKKRPIYVVGYIKDEKKFIVEAWYFNMKPAEEYKELTLNWVLDLVPKDVFKK